MNSLKSGHQRKVEALQVENEALRQALRGLLAIGSPDYVMDNSGIPGCIWCGVAYDSKHADECAWVKAQEVLADE